MNREDVREMGKDMKGGGRKGRRERERERYWIYRCSVE